MTARTNQCAWNESKAHIYSHSPITNVYSSKVRGETPLDEKQDYGMHSY
jgi:hypothetical protein